MDSSAPPAEEFLFSAVGTPISMNEVGVFAAVSCLNLGRLEEEFASLERAGGNGLHFDISDGSFIPHFTGGIDVVRAARDVTSLPRVAHLMVQKPDPHIDECLDAGCQAIVIHVEACLHLHRSLSQIREAGASPIVAISPSTPLTKLEYILNLVDRVLVLAREPGQKGEAVAPGAFERVRILKDNIRYRELPVLVEVEGLRRVIDVAVMVNEGADAIVIDSKALLTGAEAGDAVRTLRQAIDEKRKVV